MLILGVKLLDDWERTAGGYLKFSKGNIYAGIFVGDLITDFPLPYFSGSFYFLNDIFKQHYQEQDISHLNIEERKELLDQFLLDMNNLKAFI